MTTLRPSSRKQLMLQLLNKRNRAQNPISRGFTLIELLVVVVILGVLGGVGYGAYIAQLDQAARGAARTAATAMAKSCAALTVTEDQGQWDAAVSGQVTSNSTVCPDPIPAAGTTFDATARGILCEAELRSSGVVIPATCTGD